MSEDHSGVSTRSNGFLACLMKVESYGDKSIRMARPSNTFTANDTSSNEIFFLPQLF